jgi:myo-inositol-1(or 4)-monophosphatase
LKKGDPDFSFLAEESGRLPATKGGSKGRWIIDPLDGTTNFVHGFPMFCVSIAVELEGDLVAGVIYHPILDELYVATREKGATLNGKAIHVSSRKKIKEALLTTGFSYLEGENLHREIEILGRLSGLARAIRRPGSAALDLAYTARGVFDGFWETGLSPWDVAAGALLVEEAGGLVTNFSNKPFSVEDEHILAANPFLHTPLRQTIDPDSCSLLNR